MSTDRHPTASVIVFDPSLNYVLVVQHRAYGTWIFPGGHVEPGESPDHTALRELREETAVTAQLIDPHCVAVAVPTDMTVLTTPWKVLAIPAPAKPAQEGRTAEKPHLHIDFLYLATAEQDPNPVAAEQEVHGAKWVHITDLDSIGCRGDIAPLAWAALTDLFLHPSHQPGGTR